MPDVEELKKKTEELQKKKMELVDRIKALNRRLRYKEYEKKALEPFLNQTKDVRIAPLRRQKKAIEFKISTQAFTPRHEREWLKTVKKIDEELEKVREVERARRKRWLVEQDIAEAQKEIAAIEEELRSVRNELKKCYDEVRVVNAANKSGVKLGAFEDDTVALGEIGIIEKRKRNPE